MRTLLPLCSPLLDGSAKAKQHGLICTTIAEMSHSNEWLLSPESVSLLPLQDLSAVAI